MGRNKTLTVTAATGGVLILALAIQHFFGEIIGPLLFESPIEIVGGSTHGETGSAFRPWTALTAGTLYSVVSGNSDNITFEGLVNDKDGSTPPSPITNTGGWIIGFSTTAGDGSSRPQTISFCSSLVAAPGRPGTAPMPCANSLASVPNEVYVQANGYGGSGSTHFEERGLFKHHQLRFHDTGSNCDGKPTQESKCDVITSINIQTVNNPGSINGSYHCPDEKNCHVQLPKP
jgi:hypothetical protein